MDRYEKAQRKMLETIGELQGWMEELVRGVADPRSVATLMRSLGLDASTLFDFSRRATSTASSLDPYRILGLESTASDQEIKRRYRELVHKLHPDTAGVEGTEFLLQTVMAAYRQIARLRGWRP